MKNELEYQRSWAAVHLRIPRTYTLRTSTKAWDHFRNHIHHFRAQAKQWSWQIDFYMERGLRRRWWDGEELLGGGEFKVSCSFMYGIYMYF